MYYSAIVNWSGDYRACGQVDRAVSLADNDPTRFDRRFRGLKAITATVVVFP